MANARDFGFCTRVGHVKSSFCDEWVLPKWAWSGSREQFLYCGLRKFRPSKSSVYRWYAQFDRRRFVYDTWDNRSWLGRVMVECTLFMTHCLRLNLQLHTIDLVRTCRISSFCTVAWQLARLLLTRRIARSLGDSWASCTWFDVWIGSRDFKVTRLNFNRVPIVVGLPLARTWEVDIHRANWRHRIYGHDTIAILWV